MKLIIDISEEMYADVKDYVVDKDGCSNYSDFQLREIIRNGKKVIERTEKKEKELQEKFTREIEYASKEIDFTEGTDEEYYNRGYLGGLLCAYRVFFGKEYEEQEVHDE